jgi:hypothetical protein
MRDNSLVTIRHSFFLFVFLYIDRYILIPRLPGDEEKNFLMMSVFFFVQTNNSAITKILWHKTNITWVKGKKSNTAALYIYCFEWHICILINFNNVRKIYSIYANITSRSCLLRVNRIVDSYQRYQVNLYFYKNELGCFTFLSLIFHIL